MRAYVNLFQTNSFLFYVSQLYVVGLHRDEFGKQSSLDKFAHVKELIGARRG